MKKVLFIFGELNDLDIDWMIAKGMKEKIAENGTLIHEGKPVHKLFIVLDGAFKVTVGGVRQTEIAHLGAGEVIGEISFVDERPPSATVIALTNSVVLSVTQDVLNAKLSEDTAFAARFYKALAVFLAFRMRRATAHLGYGQNPSLKDEGQEPDELDARLLDNVFLAGARFDRMLKRVMGN